MAEQYSDRVVLCEGRGLARLLEAGLAWLDHNHETINALNVFPVPDGDTGTNMLLTMRSAFNEVAESDLNHVGRVASRIAHGALMGARGNSGVILSQIWRGFAHTIEDLEVFDVVQFATAMRRASDTAYKGVVNPVEGTILTVIRQAAEEAEIASEESDDLVLVLKKVVRRCHRAVAETPQLLQVLADAGVVDAGGQGLAVILEGMQRYLQGEVMRVAEPTEVVVAEHVAFEEEYNYDVQFLIKGYRLDVDMIRDQIDQMGDSTLVVGDENLIKVHVHVDDPGEPISYAISKGTILDVVVENMQEQFQEFVRAQEPAAPIVPTPKTELIEGQIGVIAVAPAEGIGRVFESLGVNHVVLGGQTMNPSTEEILSAIEDLGTDKVLVLPNNKNIILAAQSACEMAEKTARVIATRTVPQGVSALLAFDPEGNVDELVDEMMESAGEVATGEITTATRDVELDGVAVENGDILGLADGKISFAGSDMLEVFKAVLNKLETESRELLTLYSGAEITPELAQEAVEKAQDWYPEIEIELVEGGQPHYHFIISAE
ncbi:MAG: DAK2 domain-containing protein [Chloroflexota bacterium]